MTASKPSDPRIQVTSSEAAGRKHLVQPYGERPVVDRETGHAVCGLCGNPGFRRSRFRFADVSRLLLLNYPVRCTRCGQRQYMSLLVAAGATSTRPQSASAMRASADREDSWKAWTEMDRQTGTGSAPGAREPQAGSTRTDANSGVR